MENIDNLKIKKTYKNSFILEKFSFWTPNVYIPFGLETKFDNYYLNLHINDNEFKEYIKNIEIKLIEILKIDKDKLNSQLRDCENSILYTKINEFKKKILTKIVTKNNENINIFNLEKECYCKCHLFIDQIWENDDIYYYKYKIKKIILL